MIGQCWISENRRNLVCVDSYEGGILKGRFFNAYQDMECFNSLSQFLVKMEQLLDQMQQPQSYTTPRTFSSLLQPEPVESSRTPSRRGKRATFELQVLFRQHTSWQGVLHWKERDLEQSFRSVLELVLLMDSALRDLEQGDAA